MHWLGDLQPRGPLMLFKPVLHWLGQCQEQAIWSSLKSYLEIKQPPSADT
jgi:hypothetical protein